MKNVNNTNGIFPLLVAVRHTKYVKPVKAAQKYHKVCSECLPQARTYTVIQTFTPLDNFRIDNVLLQRIRTHDTSISPSSSSFCPSF